MSEITDEARELAVLWGEKLGHDWIGDKHKLASDIMNYAESYHKSKLKDMVVELKQLKQDSCNEPNVRTGDYRIALNKAIDIIEFEF